MTEKILHIFEDLKKIMTVSGFETVNADAVRNAAISATGTFFESSEITKSGSVLLYHKSKKKDAKTLLLDAHIDTIGLVISEICGDGFVRSAPVGGIDRRNLTTAEVDIFGRRKVRGIFSSIPPHLASKNGDNSLPEFADYLIDTGLCTEEAKKNLYVGAPAVFVGKTERLLGDRICSSHLDDKICCAAILASCSELCDSETDCNVTVLLSSGEETHEGGAATAAYVTRADGAVALDVNFASDKGVPEYQCSKIGDGAMISRSAVTDKRMTAIVEKCAKNAGIPHKVIAEVCGTGTNADTIEVTNLGTPCAVLSVPISYMHTPCEVCSLSDVRAAADIVTALIMNFDKMARETGTLLGERNLKGGSDK